MEGGAGSTAGRLGHQVPDGGLRVAVVSTLRDVKDQLISWVEWYRIAGFAHLFLYFDDPSADEEAIQEVLEAYDPSFLTVVRNSPELRAEWPQLRCWGQFAPYTEDRMCRQLLNIAHCVRAALSFQPQIDWLLHLDHDELFLPPPGGLQEHFEHLELGGCRLFLYQNFEAVPEAHTLAPFLDVTLFKVPMARVPRTPAGGRGLDFWAERTKAGNYFLYYDNGKSAVRLRGHHGHGSAAEFAPRSVHLLFPEDSLPGLERERAAWTNFAPAELEPMRLGWMVPQADEVLAGAKVLHYPATHFERLFRKYDHLKDFPSVRFGGGLVIPPCFHLEARDCYLEHAPAGEDVQKLKLKEMLERAAMLADPKDVAEQLRSGTVVRIRAVRASLSAGSWQPPVPLAESPLARLRRRPSVEQMERLRRMPRSDGELLLLPPDGQGGGGGGLLLKKQLQVGLDAVAERLESVGWAACPLGANPKLLAKALEEAKSVEGRMLPGTTVIKNQAVDRRLPNARRGDKILFMQEQGLNECEGPSPTPTLVLLENALTDIGFQLDARLQRSGLKLRLTERCDGMLACYEGEGASYGPHIDNADGDGRVDGRVLTVLLYLNPGWDRSHGGELALFEPLGGGELGDPKLEGRWSLVWPEAGTVVFFRADRTLHEVRPAYARRYALSLWFCGQRVGYGGDAEE